MPPPFFTRLRDYYLAVAEVLRGEAKVAAIFPNPTDVGTARENIYVEFLRQHVPSKCNVFPGGFLFGDDGNESGQLDIIITTDTAPRFNFRNSDGRGKAFSPVEGTLGVVSVKSNLDKRELEESLTSFAAIPLTAPLAGRVAPGVMIPAYDDWPYKIIYAPKGISFDALSSHLCRFYELHPEIPLCRRPNLIHVCGQYFIVRVVPGVASVWNPDDETEQKLDVGTFISSTHEPDLQAIRWALESLQIRASSSTHILFAYSTIMNRAVGIGG